AEGGRMIAASATAPALRGSAIAPAFSPDGRSAYFLGGYEKSKSVALFVSHDGGESFAARALDTARGAQGAARKPTHEPDDDDEDAPAGGATEPLQARNAKVVTVGEDGTVGIVLGQRGHDVYVTTDDDGRVLRFATAPEEDAEVAGWGRRIFALL